MTLAGNTEKDFLENMRNRSGRVTSKDPWVEFFYLLIRDEVPLHKVENIMRELEKNPDEEILYTNGWLANYCQDLAMRLQDVTNSRQAPTEKVEQ